MTAPDEFDRLYAEVRDRLLTLTYCLTGDLPSARGAVRDAFVEAWHHWRKVGRLEDPEGWVRVQACTHAQRRHTARLWHREKGLDPEVRATLEALGSLSTAQRRVLLLSELTTASLAEIAREVGLPRPDTERELQAAAAQLAVARGVPSTAVRAVLDRVAGHVRDDTAVHRWPRAPIVRRSGARRRRTHTLAGVVAAAVTLVVVGAAVSDTTGVRPTLAREVGSGTVTGSAQDAARPAAAVLPADDLLRADQVDRATPGQRWAEEATTDGRGGDGVVMPCQADRYADPRPAAALVRTFAPRRPAPGRAAPAPLAAQTVVVSSAPRAAERAYRTAVSWFAACGTPRAQLLDTRAVRHAGDEATLLVLRTFEGDGSVLVAGVARTGLLTTTTLTRLPAGTTPAPRRGATLVARAVDGLCDVDGAGACAGTPVLRPTAPVPAAPVPALLAEVDLPPVAAVRRPWVGTEPRQARTNAAATTCDHTDFSGGRFRDAVTRTFLVPGARLPAEFGLTETAGALPERQAAALLDSVRGRMSSCSDRQMGTDVTTVVDRRSGRRELAVWHVSTEISDHAEVHFLMGLVRDGGAVAQVGFVPAPGAGLPADAFVAVAERALARLAAMPSRG